MANGKSSKSRGNVNTKKDVVGRRGITKKRIVAKKGVVIKFISIGEFGAAGNLNRGKQTGKREKRLKRLSRNATNSGGTGGGSSNPSRPSKGSRSTGPKRY